MNLSLSPAMRHSGRITESYQRIAQLQQSYLHSKKLARVRVLLHIKEQPSIPLGDLAMMVGSGVTWVAGWLSTYRRQGLAAMLSYNDDNTPFILDDDQVGEQVIHPASKRSHATPGYLRQSYPLVGMAGAF